MTQNRARTFLSSTTVFRVLCSGFLASSVQGCTEPTFRDAGSDPALEDADTDAASTTSDASGLGNDAGVDGGSASGMDAGADGSAATSDATSAATSTEDGSKADSMPASNMGDAGEMATDGGSDAALPDWATPLIGTFAKRSVTFSYDDAPVPPINTRNVELSLVRITYSSGQLQLSEQFCSYTVGLKAANSASLVFKYATRLPALTGHIYLGAGDTFSSDTMLQHFGFDPTRASACGASGRRVKFPEQSWISGTTCRCDPAPVPNAIDDCRLIDGDQDGLAGITASGPDLLGTNVIEYGLVFDVSLKVVDGKINADRLPEWREVRAQAPACVNGTADGCYIGNNQLCPGGATRLLRLPAQATCADVNPGNFGPVDTFPAEVDCRAKLGTM